MVRQRLHDPSELAYDDLVECLRTIQQTLWPDGDIHHEWDAETVEKVAGVVSDAGLGPDYSGNL